MKVGIFTDSHFSSAEVTCNNRYNNKSLQKIKRAYEYYDKEKCDMVICLGDLIDTMTDELKTLLAEISGECVHIHASKRRSAD